MLRRRSSRAGLIAFLAAICSARPVFADDPAGIAATLSTDGQSVFATFDVTNAFTEAFRKRITNGLRNVALIEVTLIDSSGRPLSQGLRRCQFKLEIWDEILKVRIREATRRIDRDHQVFDRGLRECGLVSNVAVGELASMTSAAAYRLEIAVLLNPVDQETLQSAREFLSNPKGKSPGRPLTLFGSVAKLFSDKPEAGGERFRFRSNPVYRPRRTP